MIYECTNVMCDNKWNEVDDFEEPDFDHEFCKCSWCGEELDEVWNGY